MKFPLNKCVIHKNNNFLDIAPLGLQLMGTIRAINISPRWGEAGIIGAMTIDLINISTSGAMQV
jgi:hypothetical protein